MKIAFRKLHKAAVIPARNHARDAGFDLVATDINTNGTYVEYKTGIAVDIPEGYVGLLFPRSSITETDMMLHNSVGVIDSGYQGELVMRFRVIPDSDQESGEECTTVWETREAPVIGDRIGQLIIIPIPRIEFVEVQEFDNQSTRGTKGFGSTGK